MIGIISDTHDNTENTQKAIKVFEEANVDFIIHCGDITTPETLSLFKGIHTKAVNGNCDQDLEALKLALQDIGGEFLGKEGLIDLGPKKIMVYHGDNEQRLQELIDEQVYTYILTGHTHKNRNDQIEKTRIINPGALYEGENTVALLDINKDRVEFKHV